MPNNQLIIFYIDGSPLLVIKKRVYISVNPILFILRVIDNPPYRSVSKLTSPLCLYREDFPYFRLPAHCQFPSLAAWASLPNAAILYSKNYALWTPRPYAYGSKRWPFFPSTNPSSIVLIMLRYVRANSRSPRVLHTCKMSDPQIARNNYSTLIYLEMGFVITSFQMKDTPVVARCQLPFDLLKLRATEAASCQLRML